MSFLKVFFAFLLCFIFVACATEDNIVSSDEGLVSIQEIPIEIVTFSPEEVQRLKKEEGIYVTGGSSGDLKTKLPCRWSDDMDGAIYGTVDCPDGNCGAGAITNTVKGTREIVISCTNADGSISVGAGRGENPWP